MDERGSYTAAGLFHWYLEGSREPAVAPEQRAVRAIAALLADLRRFEQESLSGAGDPRADRPAPGTLRLRLDRIDAALSGCRRLAGKLGLDAAVLETSAAFGASDKSLAALVALSLRPLTRFHDEILLQRSLQVAELCLDVLARQVRAVRDSLQEKDFERASRALGQAIATAEVLSRTSAVLCTVSPERFAALREAAGDAGALRSSAYQRLETELRGGAGDPTFLSLRNLMAELRLATETSPGLRDEIFRSARELDRRLRTWRGLELGLALAAQPRGLGSFAGTSLRKADVAETDLGRRLKPGIFDVLDLDFVQAQEVLTDLPRVSGLFRALAKRATSRECPPGGLPGGSENDGHRAMP